MNNGRSKRAFRAIRFAQGAGDGEGQEMYFISAPAKWLIDNTTIDRWSNELSDDDPHQGYQRELSEAHVRAIERYLRSVFEKSKGGRVLPVFPTSILLAARTDIDFVADKSAGNEEDPWVKPGRVQIPDSVELYIIDGQHRLQGLRELLSASEPEVRGYFDYHLPVTIMVIKDKRHELLHFLTINKEAKSVRTDLAERLLRTIYSSEPGFVPMHLRGAAKAISERLTIVDYLERTEGQPWFGRIAKPNERRSGDRIASEGQLSKSLRHLQNALPLTWSSEQATQFVVDFWKALETLLPECFKNPRGYTLQAAVGFGALHRLLPNFTSYYSAEDGLASFKKILKGVSPFFTEPEYWARKTGEASQYSSEGAYAQHATLIQDAVRDKLSR